MLNNSFDSPKSLSQMCIIFSGNECESIKHKDIWFVEMLKHTYCWLARGIKLHQSKIAFRREHTKKQYTHKHRNGFAVNIEQYVQNYISICFLV